MLPDRSTASIRSRPTCGGCDRLRPSCLRARGGEAQQDPREPCERSRRRGRATHARRAAATASMSRAVGHACSAADADARRRQQPARQQRQRQRDSHQGQRTCAADAIRCLQRVDHFAIHSRNALPRTRRAAHRPRAASTSRRNAAFEQQRRRGLGQRRRSRVAASSRKAQPMLALQRVGLGSRRRAARRNSSDIAATCAGRRRWLRECRVEQRARSRAVRALTAAPPRTVPRRSRPAPATSDAATSPAPAATTAGAGGGWMSRRTSVGHAGVHATPPAVATPSKGSQDSLARRSAAPARARRAQGSSLQSRPRPARRTRCASAGAAARWRGRVRRDGRRSANGSAAFGGAISSGSMSSSTIDFVVLCERGPALSGRWRRCCADRPARTRREPGRNTRARMVERDAPGRRRPPAARAYQRTSASSTRKRAARARRRAGSAASRRLPRNAAMRSPSRAAAHAAMAPARAACTDLKRTRVPKYSDGAVSATIRVRRSRSAWNSLVCGAAGARGEAPVDMARVVADRRTRATRRTPCRVRAAATARVR